MSSQFKSPVLQLTFFLQNRSLLKFRFSKKSTRFEPISHMIWSLNSKCQIAWEIVSNFCSLFRISKLYGRKSRKKIPLWEYMGCFWLLFPPQWVQIFYEGLSELTSESQKRLPSAGVVYYYYVFCDSDVTLIMQQLVTRFSSYFRSSYFDCFMKSYWKCWH